MSEEKKQENVINQNSQESDSLGSQKNENTINEAQDEKTDLILGKFKTVEDLKTAYQNLQKQQGEQSVELGELRKLKQALQQIAEKKQEEDSQKTAKEEYINNFLSKYDNENYFQNDAFKTLYSAAFDALGTDLDTDGFVQKLEDYVVSRILLKEQLKNAQDENKNATDSLNFSKGEAKSTEKKLRFQDIPQDELEKYIAKYV